MLNTVGGRLHSTTLAGGYGKSGCHPFFRQNLTFWRKIFFGDDEESAGASTAGVLLYRDSK